MGDIRTSANAAFRDYVIDGVPASGAHDPVKSAIRSTMGVVEDRIDAVSEIASNGLVGGYTTLAALNLDLDHDAGALAKVGGDGANDGVYIKSGASGAGSWALFDDPVIAAADDAEAAQALAEAAALSVPGAAFDQRMTTLYPRKVIRRVWIRGGDPTHTYILSALETSANRIRMDFHDLTDGVDVARVIHLPGVAIDYETAPTQLKAFTSTLGTVSGIEIDVEADWTAVEISDTVHAYATLAAGGIDAANVYPIEAVRQAIFDAPREVIRIGAAETHTTPLSALNSLYDDGAAPANPNEVAAARAHFKHMIALDLVDVGVDPTVSDLVLPDFVFVRGLGQTLVKSDLSDAVQVFEAPYSGGAMDIRVWTAAGYAVHDDNANNRSALSGVGDAVQHWTIDKLWVRVGFLGGPAQDDPIYGCGMSSGQINRFDGCWGDRENRASTEPIWIFHTSEGTTLPPRVEFSGARSPFLGAAVVVISGTVQTVPHYLVLESSDFHLVSGGSTMAVDDVDMYDLAIGRRVWEIVGDHAGAVSYDDPGMIVLGTTPGAAVAGDAAALIFGDVDDQGHGEKLILDTSVRSLGARLGDCSSVNKTLTIDGVSHVFTTNLTAATNADIIAAINATLVADPVAEVRLDRFIYPDVGHTRVMQNSSGAAIEAKRFVTLSALGTLELADDGDDVVGWTLKRIDDGAWGEVIVNPRFALHYFQTHISGSATGPALGPFGVTAGVLDAAAATKIGRVLPGGVIRLF